MAVRCLVNLEMVMGVSISEKRERANWRGVMLMLVLVSVEQPGSEKFMFAVCGDVLCKSG